ncbi:zinc-binding dehydrogenase [Sporormia fimetaria CBS 119925]|uniref:Zinc-binding dehydrogenase n=1 Tax=Sporormia fimetaria CBS 119925 TaxID=1340428 RepID=A0A6A6VAM6_9PLEO|nr:zinc-binding dehydrogenase [Sporormia fimetaria CBS 119925]
MPPTNKAAWLTGKQIRPLEVKEAPYTAPSQNQIVVKVHAIAVNPIDAFKQAMGDVVLSWIQYPFILGSDVAGEVVEIGPGATRFKPGDRVVGFAVGADKRSNRSSESAFQEYVVLRENLASPIPDALSYEKACVLPLGLSTAACGMYMKDYLALELPAPTTPRDTGKTLVIWGGSTSVGSNAIQLAVASGYHVITTASPKNFEYVKRLGASEAFDYSSPTVIADITESLKTKTLAGAMAIGAGSTEALIDIVGAASGHKFISQASLVQPSEYPPKGMALVSFIGSFLWFKVSTLVRSKMKGVGVKFIWGSDLLANEVGSAIYEHFLPEALAAGRYTAAPEPNVVGEGLESVQGALDVILKGVSVQKVVVKL